MNSPADPQRRDAERLTALEMLLTHLEHTVQSLDETLRAQQKQIDGVARRLDQLTSDVGLMRDATPEVRKPEDEKPPHY